MAKSLIYLDHAATAYPRHPSVGKAMVEALSIAGSPGRGGHGGAAKGGGIVKECRERLAALFGARDPERFILLPSSTVALSTVIYSLCPPMQRRERTLLIGPLEHNAVRRPAVQRFGEPWVTTLPAQADGSLDLGRLAGQRTHGVAGVVLQHASNVNGVIQRLREMGEWCLRRELPFVVDGAQAAGLVPVELESIPGLCAYTMAAHKNLGGPPGVGVLWLRPGFDPPPLWIGGNGVDSAQPRIPDSGPARYESGTPNLPGIAGLLAALETYDEDPLAARFEELQAVRARWKGMLASLAAVELIGEEPAGEQPPAPRTPVISFRLRRKGGELWDPELLSEALEDRIGARCRAGLHCAPLAHIFFGTMPLGTTRIAPGRETTAAALKKVRDTLAALAEE